ncbi:MAG: CBS domain-containing protein [Chloroflexi bacterium]|nr:CBS domain-containing protein [Chloroflexota bacterium]
MLNEKIGTLKLAAPPSVEIGTSVGEVINEFQRHTIGCMLIFDQHKLVGIMTERDVLMKIVARDVAYEEPIEKFMTPDPMTFTPDCTIGDAIGLMDRDNFRNIPIVSAETGECIAVFSIKDVIDYVVESFPEQVMNLPPRPHQEMKTPEGA